MVDLHTSYSRLLLAELAVRDAAGAGAAFLLLSHVWFACCSGPGAAAAGHLRQAIPQGAVFQQVRVRVARLSGVLRAVLPAEAFAARPRRVGCTAVLRTQRRTEELSLVHDNPTCCDLPLVSGAYRLPSIMPGPCNAKRFSAKRPSPVWFDDSRYATPKEKNLGAAARSLIEVTDVHHVSRYTTLMALGWPCPYCCGQATALTHRCARLSPELCLGEEGRVGAMRCSPSGNSR